MKSTTFRDSMLTLTLDAMSGGQSGVESATQRVDEVENLLIAEGEAT